MLNQNTRFPLAVTVRISVAPSPPWRRGQKITLKATVIPEGYYSVQIWLTAPREELIAWDITAPDGTLTYDWVIPDDLACNIARFKAVETGTGTSSTEYSGAVAYPTRVSISAPSRVGAGQSFTVSGKLEYEESAGVWRPLAGRTVSLYYNGTKIGDVTTGSDGSYSKPDARIPEAGTYTLRAVFAGEGLAFPPAFTLHGLSIGFPPELAPLAQYAPYVLAAFPLILVGGAIAYSQLAPGS